MEVNRLSLSEISALLREGKVSSVEVTEKCIRAAKGSSLNALNYLAEDQAREAALAADRRLKEGTASPLTGVPVVVKDNICIKDMPATCSSKMLESYIPPYDAFVVRRLKEAGAVILGKSNMDEFAMGSSNETSYFGPVKNPVNPEYVPGGSSGGSAAAVGASLAYTALGSDTGGSIRQPAALCGVVGLKPTYGTVSRYGLIAFGSSLDQIGCFTRSVRDSALVLNSIAGYDAMDSTSQKLDYPDYTAGFSDSVRGLRIGVAREHFGEGLNPEVKAALEQAIAFYEENGAEIVELSMPLNEVGISVYYVIACAEAASNLARYDGIKYGYRADDFTDLIDLYTRTRTEGFGAEVKRRIMLGNYVLSSGYYDAYYLKALKVRTLIKEEYRRAFEQCDVMLTPTSPTTAFRFGEKTGNPLEMYLSDIYTVTVNIAGLPGISVPCGRDAKGLPIGMQLIAAPFDEPKLLRTAEYYESREGSQWITR